MRSRTPEAYERRHASCLRHADQVRSDGCETVGKLGLEEHREAVDDRRHTVLRGDGLQQQPTQRQSDPQLRSPEGVLEESLKQRVVNNLSGRSSQRGSALT